MTAPETNVAADLGRLFAPWREALLAAALRPERDAAGTRDDPCVWIEADYPRDDPAFVSRIIEAIELFVLLERVDRIAWLNEARMLATDWRGDPWTQDVFEVQPSPRLCGWKMCVNGLDATKQVCTYLSQEAREDDALSADYLQFRHALENMIEPSSSQSMALMLDVRLPLPECRRVWEALPPVVALAGVQHAAAANALVNKLCSRLEYVSLPLTGLSPADDSVLDQLVHLCRCGVAIDRFPDLNIAVTRGNAVAFVKTLHALLGSRCGGISGRTRRATIVAKGFPLGSIESAATDATILDSVQASFPNDSEDDAGEQTSVLYWVAYALFSCDASVRHVNLNCNELTMAKVETMGELLHSDEPLAVLFQDLASSILDHKRTRLSASRFLLFDPTNDDGDHPALDGTRYSDLRVLDTVDQWWIVLLPGWGKAWVHVDYAQPSQVEASVNAAKTIESLDLIPPQDPAVTVALLRLVGENVASLVTQFAHVPQNGWLDILNCCPMVHELTIDGLMWSQLSSIVGSLTNSHAKKLRRLVIRVRVLSSDNVGQVREILTALSDQHHPFARQIREFEFSAGAMFGEPLIEVETFSHALRMLDENKMLQLFRFHFPVPVPSAVESTALKEAFDRHHRHVLPVEANPLGVREKAAFLSVFTAEKIPSVMRELDQGVTATIFHFAAEPCYRCVDVLRPRVPPIPQ